MNYPLLLLNIAIHASLVVLLAVLLARYFLSPFATAHTGVQTLLTASSRPNHRLHAAPRPAACAGFVALLFVASRLMFLILGGVILQIDGECSFLSYLRNLPAYWSQWDARHYIALAEDWYVNTGDERLKLVFYPLYPLLVRIVNAVLRNTVGSAYLVSNLCLLGSGIVMYRITAREYDHAAARRAVFFLMFAPISFYFSVPYTESAFLLMTLLAVDFAMQRKWAPALLFGALSAFTRSLGLLTAVCIFYEMLICWRARTPRRPVRQLLRPAYLKHMGKSALLCCLVALGLGAYLLLNYQVSGDPLRFLQYQSEHWHQEFGSVWYTVSYSFRNAQSFSDAGYITGVWIPQLLYLCAAIAIQLLCMNRVRPGYGAYALLYTYAAYAPTWLLSGPRYMTALFALYPMLALLTRRKWAFYLLSALSLVGCVLLTHQFLIVRRLL